MCLRFALRARGMVMCWLGRGITVLCGSKFSSRHFAQCLLQIPPPNIPSSQPLLAFLFIRRGETTLAQVKGVGQPCARHCFAQHSIATLPHVERVTHRDSVPAINNKSQISPRFSDRPFLPSTGLHSRYGVRKTKKERNSLLRGQITLVWQRLPEKGLVAHEKLISMGRTGTLARDLAG